MSRDKKLTTSITFTGDDLSALAKYVSAGVIILQTSHPVISKLKSAFTRLGLPTPKGL
ncbi:hypothetical protein HY439_02545 [Candidatus Microgenomates bacterium]|nr:hypothetical protein [Candidatus Microgenomates bacterium]